MPIIELEQTVETPLTTIRSPWNNFVIRFAYRRSRDCQLKGETGQDYLIIQLRPNRVVFSLCDGVGQSFQGQLGAQLLGRSLQRWLWKVPKHSDTFQIDLDRLRASLRDYLDTQKIPVTEFINKVKIEGLEGELLREVQLERREKSGTQSNFVCGLFDSPSTALPNGQVILFWLGDAKLQIWQNEINKTSELNATWNSKEGWSSKHGVTGEIHFYRCDLSQIDSLVASSDGLDPIRADLHPEIPDEELEAKLISLMDLPKNDDLSFLEIRAVKLESISGGDIDQSGEELIQEDREKQESSISRLSYWYKNRWVKFAIILLAIFLLLLLCRWAITAVLSNILY